MYLKRAILVISCAILVQNAQAVEKIFGELKSGHQIPNSELILKKEYLFNNIYMFETENGKELISELNKSNAFVYTEKNHRAKVILPEIEPLIINKEKGMNTFGSYFNDPKASAVWSFNSSEQNGIDVVRAYHQFGSAGTKEVIVAVVDTGVDYRHEDLKDVMWVNKNEIPGNNIDDDNNGVIDDIHGIDTIDRAKNGQPTGDMMDTHNHGTHVAGTIAAKQNNRKGIAGIASNVKIMGIRTVPNAADETDANIITSFLYAARNGAKIINCSYGKKKAEKGLTVSKLIDYIGKKFGVLVIAAAGNDGKNIDKKKYFKYPASYQNESLLVVAATTSGGPLAKFSNYGMRNVDIAAPGAQILSTIRGNRYAAYSGTSMAAPTTAGVAAEVLSHHPELSAIGLKKVLMRSTTRSRIYDKVQTSGRVNLLNALKLARAVKRRYYSNRNH